MSSDYVPKWLRPLLKEARDNGWQLSGGGSTHYKLCKAGETPVIVSSSMGDNRRGQLQARAIMRRRGVIR